MDGTSLHIDGAAAEAHHGARKVRHMHLCAAKLGGSGSWIKGCVPMKGTTYSCDKGNHVAPLARYWRSRPYQAH